MSRHSVAALCATLLLAAAPLAPAQYQLSTQLMAEKLGIGDGTVQLLDLPESAGAPFEVDVVLGGGDFTLVLAPHSMWAEDGYVLVQLADGSFRTEAPAPSVTYRGVVSGVAGSAVAASLVDGQLQAYVRLAADLPPFGIDPASSIDALAPRAAHVVYDAADTLPMDISCGTVDVAQRPHAPGEGVGGADGAADNKVCQIACDADFEYYGKNSSSVTATQNDITAVINAVETIYKNDVNIEYDITTIIVRTAEPDPYTTSSSGSLLSQFASTWNANHQSVVRDVAHLFTGKNLSGSTIGIAYLSVICSQGSGYGLSESKYTGSFTFRTGLTAHELGHNWSANHCDGAGDCWIMCSGIGGCAGNVTKFGTGSKNSINAKKNSVGCLSNAVPPPPPSITTIVPGSVTAFLPSSVVLTGTNFAEANSMSVGGTVLQHGAGFTVNSNTQITLLPPAPTSLGAKNVTVTHPGGTSPAKTLTYVETNPPKLSASTLAGAGQLFAWSWGGGIGDTGFLIVSTQATTAQVSGQTILAVPILLTSQTLTGIGIGSLSLTLPASAQGLFIWSQFVTADGGGVLASDIINTWIIL